MQQFPDRAAYYLGEINAAHPFREGNGRTQREFIRELAAAAGFDLSWRKISRDEMTEASILSSRSGDNSGLATLVAKCLT